MAAAGVALFEPEELDFGLDAVEEAHSGDGCVGVCVCGGCVVWWWWMEEQTRVGFRTEIAVVGRWDVVCVVGGLILRW